MHSEYPCPHGLRLVGIATYRRVTSIKELRQAGYSPTIPVVILSTSSNPRDVADCYRLGAAGYLCKPLSIHQYKEKMRGLIHYWFDAVMLPEEGR